MMNAILTAATTAMLTQIKNGAGFQLSYSNACEVLVDYGFSESEAIAIARAAMVNIARESTFKDPAALADLEAWASNAIDAA